MSKSADNCILVLESGDETRGAVVGFKDFDFWWEGTSGLEAGEDRDVEFGGGDEGGED